MHLPYKEAIGIGRVISPAQMAMILNMDAWPPDRRRDYYSRAALVGFGPTTRRQTTQVCHEARKVMEAAAAQTLHR